MTNQEQARYRSRGEAAPWLARDERYERTVAWVSEALHAAPGPCVTPDGLLLGYQAWLVTASRQWQ